MNIIYVDSAIDDLLIRQRVCNGDLFERYVPILAELKPKFVHHPQSMKLVQNLLEELALRSGNNLYRRSPLKKCSTRQLPSLGIDLMLSIRVTEYAPEPVADGELVVEPPTFNKGLPPTAEQATFK